MFGIAVAIAVLLTVVLALLAVPVVLVIDAERADRLRMTWRLRWLFGLVDIRSPRRVRTLPSSDRSAATRSRPSTTGKRWRKTRMGLAVLRTRGLIRQVARLAWRVRRQITLKEFHVRTSFGLDDPAATGVVYGAISPLLVMARMGGVDVDCRPMFHESGLTGAVGGTIQVRPLSVVGALVAFLVSAPVLRSMRAAWRARK
ncbi:MAG TPA: hypothetical protein VFV98_18030 [Vicinamibacterales bacterium]|nr:hypothetical protein [Vicinamibacterales bacterium]